MKVCSTCNKEVTDSFTEFKCPGCGKNKLVRCEHCRETSAAYRCVCGFTGP
ncbi:MAG: zinc finger domain-containing protein [Candidatus Diapherotrites archaeon]|nr:RNA-binding protein [Candidatus Micrarchaeota archaeon]MBU1939374.1 RNA-binding protein [Candidatus Micrarchaeota archaeon]